MIKNNEKLKDFQMLDFIKSLIDLGERQGETAGQAGDLIMDLFRHNDIFFKIEKFKTFIPVVSSFGLLVDGKKVDCLSTSFTGGKINGNDSIVSSLISSQPLISKLNINFNPKCKSISRSNFYFAPSLAIKTKDVGRVVSAKKVSGFSVVKKTEIESKQILVGNIKNPKTIIFCHYDSVGPGAVDNVSGTAVLLKTIINNKGVLKNNLFVFDGNEELSYDFPVYWGYGYRVFEKRYGKLMIRAKQLVSVDSVGNGRPVVIKDPWILKLAFPIKNLEKLLSKTVTIAGNIDALMRVYHSDDDTVSELELKYLDQTVKKLERIITR